MKLLAGNLIDIRSIQYFVSAGSPTGRHMIDIGVTANPNIPTKWGSVIKISSTEVKGGYDPANPKFETGVRVTACDGVWISDSHIENSSIADVRVTADGVSTLGNLHIANTMLDIAKSHALLIDGTGSVGRVGVKANLSGNGQGTGTQHGIYVTGDVDLYEADFDVGVSGFNDCAVRCDTTGEAELSLHLRPARQNNASGNDLGAVWIGGAAKMALTGTIRDTNDAPSVYIAPASTAVLTMSGVNGLHSAGPIIDASGGTATLYVDPCPGLSWLKGSKTWDPPSMVDGSGASTTVTVNGAVVGDRAEMSLGIDLVGMLSSCYVSAPNTVTVVLQNETGVTVNLASSTLSVDVFKRF